MAVMVGTRRVAAFLALLLCLLGTSASSSSFLRRHRQRLHAQKGGLNVKLCSKLSQDCTTADFQPGTITVDADKRSIACAELKGAWTYISGENKVTAIDDVDDVDNVDKKFPAVNVALEAPTSGALNIAFLTPDDLMKFMKLIDPTLGLTAEEQQSHLADLSQTLAGLDGISAIWTEPTLDEEDSSSFRLAISLDGAKLEQDSSLLDNIISKLETTVDDVDTIEQISFRLTSERKSRSTVVSESGWVTDQLGGKDSGYLVGGVSISAPDSSEAGTLGGFLIPTDWNTEEGAALYALTNNHVLPTADGTAVCQPAQSLWTASHPDCGTETVGKQNSKNSKNSKYTAVLDSSCCQRMGDKLLDDGLFVAGVQSTAVARYLDVAVVPIDYATRYKVKCAVQNIGLIQGTSQPREGMHVRKSGARTGLTTGIILQETFPVEINGVESESDYYFVIEGMTPIDLDSELGQSVEDDLIAALTREPLHLAEDAAKDTLKTLSAQPVSLSKGLALFVAGGDSGAFVVNEQNEVVGIVTSSGFDALFRLKYPTRDLKSKPSYVIDAVKDIATAHPINMVLDQINSRLADRNTGFQLEMCTASNRPPPPRSDKGCKRKKGKCLPAPYCKRRPNLVSFDYCRLRKDLNDPDESLSLEKPAQTTVLSLL